MKSEAAKSADATELLWAVKSRSELGRVADRSHGMEIWLLFSFPNDAHALVGSDLALTAQERAFEVIVENTVKEARSLFPVWASLCSLACMLLAASLHLWSSQLPHLPSVLIPNPAATE